METIDILKAKMTLEIVSEQAKQAKVIPIDLGYPLPVVIQDKYRMLEVSAQEAQYRLTLKRPMQPITTPLKKERPFNPELEKGK